MVTPINLDDVTAAQSSVSRRRSLFILLLCAVLALLVFGVYATLSANVGGGQVIMPLDDAYIHFQYAHQIAVGQPYVYNPGLPPTSGATSFLYPYILALGDLLGFRGLNLGLWAMGIGAVALAISAWLVYRIVRLCSPDWLALIFAVGFALDGWIEWHFMSGMETGLAILLLLLTLFAVLDRRFRLSVIAMTLLALIRPEGGLLAAIAAGIVLLQNLLDVPVKGKWGVPRLWLWRREWLLLLIPVLAVGVQPLVNLLLTGSAVASGNAAKSLFGIVGADFGTIIGRVLANFGRMWREFLIQYGYVFASALIGWSVMIVRKRWRLIGVMIALWLLAGTAAISTLDTAFWHFKRYQMPLIALFFPLAGWGWTFVYQQGRRWLPRLTRRQVVPALVVVAVIVGASISAVLTNTVQFLSNYALNVGYVVSQPLQMARWLAANTLDDARIAVHDVGMMRYMGGRTTIDIVGLTTPGAAGYWRNGPGSVGEFIERARPDTIASYGEGHGLGLGYLQHTDLYAETLASYTVNLDPVNNVALAAPTQGIYRPDWTTVDRASDVIMLPRITPYLDGLTLVDQIDVADVEFEAEHDYQWRNDLAAGSFPTEYYEFNYLGCGEECRVTDGGRRINGAESFTLTTHPQQDLILVTRLHPAEAGTFDVYANDQLIGTRVIPALPGSWYEVPTLIPAALVGAETRIRIEPHVSGDYMPYQHWAYQGDYQPAPLTDDPLATFEDGAIQLAQADATLSADARALTVNLTWQTEGGAQGDCKVFVHVLDADGASVAQADLRPGNDNLPPGNWIAGAFRDTIEIALPESSRGQFQVIMGLYDPVTFQRLPVNSSAATADNSLLIGTVEVK